MSVCVISADIRNAVFLLTCYLPDCGGGGDCSIFVAGHVRVNFEVQISILNIALASSASPELHPGNIRNGVK